MVEVVTNELVWLVRLILFDLFTNHRSTVRSMGERDKDSESPTTTDPKTWYNKQFTTSVNLLKRVFLEKC